MAHSTPIAEPIGIIVGLTAGEFASYVAEKAANKLDLDKKTTKAVATLAAHFTASVVTKAVINIVLADPIGLGINPATAAFTAVGHASVKYAIDEIKSINYSPQQIAWDRK
jgi:hypothetical protein